jgi:uncharacterized membrane protein YjgN (DUF898 family)
MPLVQGQVLQNRYRVARLLGQGGFGAVYRGWDLNLNKPVAIKENLDISPEAQKQFQNEAQILSGLSHPNLPRVTDHFLLPDMGQYLVMDFVEGEDLQSMLDEHGRLPETQVLPWMEQVCDALGYLHTRQPPIIHRDIKPANIKITPQGQAMLVDFGISKIYDPVLKTTVGARAVTPGYSPPEQYGHGTTDQRSDLYALGATMYTLLTGQEPPESIERMANNVPLTPPRQITPMISTSVESAILRACELVTTHRLQSVNEFRQALKSQPFMAMPPVPQPPIAQPRPGTPMPVPTAGPGHLEFRGTWADLLGAVLVVVVLSFVTFGLYAPWGYVHIRRVVIANTYHQNRPLQFDGSGLGAFGQFLIIALLSTVTLGLYAILGFAQVSMLQWEASHTILPDGRRLEFRGSALGLFVETLIVVFFSLITLGLYFFWGYVRLRRYIVSNLYPQQSSQPMQFTGAGTEFFGVMLVNALLSMITFGLYALLMFGEVRTLKWDASNTIVPS